MLLSLNLAMSLGWRNITWPIRKMLSVRSGGIVLALATAAVESLLESAESDVARARLGNCHQGIRHLAFLIIALGSRLDDGHALQVAAGLRLGTAICALHLCRHCGAEVDKCGSP